MNTFDLSLSVKSIDDKGVIEGVAAGYGNLDLGGDIIIPGAMAKSIAAKSTMPMLRDHDLRHPVGVWNELTDTSDGLQVKGRFALSSSAGREAHALVHEGALTGLSIGYMPVKHRMVGKARELQEVRLHEISLVSVPMNERATITSVKSIVEGGELPSMSQLEDLLRDAGGFSRSQAKAIAAHGLKHLLSQREAGREVDEKAEFLSALQSAMRAG